MDKKLKVAFIHGRPKGHATHAMYANLVHSSFFHEDRLIRWQDTSSSKLKRYFSWLVNAVFFPKLRSWDIIFTEGVRIPHLIQKKLGLLSKRQKLIALMGDESLYFTYSKQYPSLTLKIMTHYWKSCDAIICIGDFQADLAKKILPESQHHKVYTIFNGNPEHRIEALKKIEPKLDSNNITYIGHASTLWRASYKGLDLTINAFSLSAQKRPELRLNIIGEIPESLQEQLLKEVPAEIKEQIHFIGRTNELSKYLKDSSLYLHCGKGEAWGISITEALLAGIPSMVTNLTGAQQVVKGLGDSFVLPPDANQISKAMLNYYSLKQEEKKALSKRSKEIVNNLTEEAASKKFQEVFAEIRIKLNLN